MSLLIGQMKIKVVKVRCAATQIAFFIRFTRLGELLRPSFCNTRTNNPPLCIPLGQRARWPRGGSREPARRDLPHEGARRGEAAAHCSLT